MIRIDTTDRSFGILILAALTAIVLYRGFFVEGGFSSGLALMAGLPASLALVVLFLRWGEPDTPILRKTLAGFGGGGAVVGGLFYGAISNTELLILYSLALSVFLAIWSSKLEATSGETTSEPSSTSVRGRSGRRARWQLVAVILGVTMSSFVYRWLNEQQLEQTSALFIGIPAALAIAVALMGQGRSATGTALKATLLGLLIASIFLGEGLVCVVVAAPLFLAVAALVGRLVDRTRRRKRASALVMLAFLPMSLEGVHPELSFERDETVVVEGIVLGDPAQVRRRLERTPEFSSPFPVFFHLGFPLPVAAWGEGLQPDSLRQVRFAGGEGEPGILTLKVASTQPGCVLFRAVADDSHIAHWLMWTEIEVAWEEMDSGETRVRWTLQYRRDLDPAWYFGPIERYAVRLAGEYLLEAVTGAAP